MVKLKNYINIFLGMLVVLILQACRDKCSEGERGNPYIAMPMIITPVTDTIRLGDTLTVKIEIPFDNINTRNGNRIDISRSSISKFSIGHALHVKTNDTIRTVYGLDQFKIIYEKGGGGAFTSVGTRNDFVKEANRFIFIAKVIPLRKGLVNLVNYRAEGEMDKGCVAIDFTPVCGNADKHHNLYYDYSRFLGPSDYVIPNNHYYVWVK